MSAGGAEWYGFAYGEDVESPNGRSLGFRLLAPAGPETWSAEVEALARRLQAAPYPDQWPSTDSATRLPQRHHHSQKRQGVRILPPNAGVDFPALVNESQIRGPNKFANIEPERSTSDKEALRKR